MNRLEIIKSNFSKYLEEIPNSLGLIQKMSDEYSGNEDLYTFQSRIFLERMDTLMRDLEDYLRLNEIRAMAYPYTIRFETHLHEIFMDAAKAGRVISSFQKGIHALNSATKINLVNILRGSTILCFDYDQTNYDDNKFDREDLNKKFHDVCAALNQDDENISKQEVEKILPETVMMNRFLSSLKNLTPVPGAEVKSVALGIDYYIKPITFSEDIRKTINFIKPATKRKSEYVDWENSKASGFVREINNVTKSFILFDDENEDVEAGELIKLHYREDSIEKHVYKNFKKKVTIEFSKEKSKYFVERLS
jgi:hypothetical protein